jgi:hypothetical protein
MIIDLPVNGNQQKWTMRISKSFDYGWSLGIGVLHLVDRSIFSQVIVIVLKFVE